jgi:SPX domain protein involved in polyphosphate accumulation
MSGHAAFYGAFPRIFRQEQNIAENKKLYTRYIALANELESYFTTNEGIDGKKRTESEFVHYIDQQLAKFHNFAIGFDSSKVPNYKDTYEGLKG